MRVYYNRKRARSAVDLRAAIESGDYAAVKRTIGRRPCLVHCPTGRRADLPVHCPTGRRAGLPVHAAAQVGHRRIVGPLPRKGADPNARNGRRRTPAHLSVLHRKHRVARLLFGDGADPTAADGSNNTALDLAALMNEKRCLNVLLDCEMPKSVVNKAFYKAAVRDNTVLMNKLLNRGADIDHANDTTGHTALLEAVKRKRSRTVQFLLEKGADPSARDSASWSCLHYAVHYWFSDRILSVIFEKLAARGNLCRTVELKTSDSQETALHIAAAGGNGPALYALLRVGARPDVVDRVGCTPLLSAVSHGRNAVAALLLSVGASPERVPGSVSHATPLHVVVARRGPENLALARHMLARGAVVVDRRNDDLDRTVIHSVCESGDVDMLECLLEYTGQDVLDAVHGPRRSRAPIVLAAAKGHGTVVGALLARGVDVNARAGDETALHAAARAGSTALVDRLLDAGARTDARGVAGAGRRPVEVAMCAHGRRSAVTARLMHSDRLAKAVVRDDADAVAFLLACDVTPNATTDKYGGTPLHVAVRHRRYRMAAVLLSSARCRMTVRYNGRTALDQALAMGDERAAEMMTAVLERTPSARVAGDARR